MMSMAANTLLNMYHSFLRTIRSQPIRRRLLRAIIVEVAVLVLLINPVSSQVLGSGTIFMATLAVAIPPFLPASVHIFIMIALLFCLIIAWAWTCAATAAAFAVRSPALLLKQTQAENSIHIPGVLAAVQDQLIVYSGYFLDPRSSAMFGIFFFVGTFFLAVVLGYFPGTTILGFFALILMDSAFTNNPLLPTQSYFGSSTFVVSAACYAAVSIISLAVVFPESFNHAWLIAVREDILIPTIVFLGMNLDQATDSSTAAQFVSRLKSTMQMIEDRQEALNLDFSVHRLSPEEHHALHGWIKRIVNRVKNIERLQTLVMAPSNDEIEDGDRRNIEGASFDGSRAQVFDACSDLKLACRVALMEIDEWIQECTKDSWISVFSQVDRRKTDFRHLKLDMSRSNLRMAQVKVLNKGKWPDFIDRAKKSVHSPQRNGGSGLRHVVIALSLMDHIDLLANELEGVIGFLLAIEEREPKPIPRLPRVFTRSRRQEVQQGSESRSPSLFTPSPLLKQDQIGGYVEPGSSTPYGSSSSRDPKTLVTQTIEFTSILSASNLPSISSPPSISSQISNRVKGKKRSKVIDWILDPVTAYAFRFSILSVAIFSLCLSESTAAFFSLNSGSISLILAQSYLTIYAGDQIYLFLVRFAGTLLGLMLVLPIWYISAGGGTGNPYVLVVVTTIFVIPSLLVTVSTNNRVHLFFAMFASSTLMSSTFHLSEDIEPKKISSKLALTIIWGETRTPAFPTYQIIFKNIWLRALLDVIGFAASLVIAMLPMPFTVRNAFHRTLAQALSELAMLLRIGSEGNVQGGLESTEAQANLLLSLEKKHAVLEHFTTSMKFDPRFR
ncbi:hypothetical protein CPB84DRAFT_271485 [Gymnopilus junonius]|uniref:Putative ER transporter 6TM N-terminal domain-containing protein n=1 Tax=Gymnopilus junonius TaxID=109634 RepID=A0A9P5NXC1_GYMJU|nr:hypothetical protein CPB84DRAFT_271485 [Gymnopilus junonius]